MILELATLALAAASDGEDTPDATFRLLEVDRLRVGFEVPLLTDEEKLAFLLEEPPRGSWFVVDLYTQGSRGHLTEHSVAIFRVEILPKTSSCMLEPNVQIHLVKNVGPNFNTECTYSPRSDCEKAVQSIARSLYLPMDIRHDLQDQEVFALSKWKGMVGEGIL